MRKELRRVPIHMREVAFCYPDRSDAAPPHLGRLEMDLEPNVEGPLPLVPKIVGGRGLRLGLMAVGQQRLDRDNPRTDLRREGFGGEGTERHALPTLEIARAPVVKERRSEEHTSELQSLMRISYAVFCLKKKNIKLVSRNNQYI